MWAADINVMYLTNNDNNYDGQHKCSMKMCCYLLKGMLQKVVRDYIYIV